MPKELPSPELLRKLLRYDAATGKLYWRKREPEAFSGTKEEAVQFCRRWNVLHSGKEAFTAKDSYGYKVGRIFDVQYRAHRVIWAISHGKWPENIDHLNGVKHDNRIGNLKSVSILENNKNLSLSSRNKSGVVGVSWVEKVGKWRVDISDRRKRHHVGLFSNFEDAVFARKEAEKKYGYHENHGKSPKARISSA